jgi:DNA-binding CsgD family transcriptional regulator
MRLGSGKQRRRHREREDGWVAAGMLSAEAVEWYERLLRDGDVDLSEDDLAGEAVQELIRRGIAVVLGLDGRRLQAAPPEQAMGHFAEAIERELADQRAQAQQTMAWLQQLTRTHRRPSSASDMARLLTDRNEIADLAAALYAGAEQRLATITTEHHGLRPLSRETAIQPPSELVARGVEFRILYTAAALEEEHTYELAHATVAAGGSVRVAPQLPVTMVIVDARTALVPLDETGDTGALLIRAPAIMGALCDLFDGHWRQAIPLREDHDGPEELTPGQQAVLQLLAAGLKDEAIARRLQMSARTVRRHVAALLHLLDVGTRFAAGAAAARRGWLD